MKILYIDHHAALPSSGGDCRAVQLAQGWQQCGDTVTIVAAGEGSRTPCGDMEETHAEGVTFCRLSAPPPSRGVGGSRKSMQVFLKKLYVSAPALAEHYHPELVIAAGGYPYDFFCAQRTAKLAGAKTVFELREPWPEWQRERYAEDDSRLNRCIADYAMGYALRNADLTVSFLPRGEDYCRDRGQQPARFITLPAPAPPAAQPKPLKEEDAAAIHALREKYPTLIAYAGPLTARRLPVLLVGAVGRMGEQGVAAVIAGNGGYKQLLRRTVRENGWENVLLTDGMTEGRQRTLYHTADLLYYGDDRRCDARYGGYAPFLLRLMQNGKPILTATHSSENAALRAGAALSADATQQGVEQALERFLALTGEEKAALGAAADEALQTTHAAGQVARDYRSALLRLWV